jgi:DNA-binding NtrC family response regulator
MIQFAARRTKEPRPIPTIPTTDLPLRPRGILIVDDTDVIRALLDVGLRAAGFVVWLANGGLAGVDSYLEHAAGIDVVLLDVRMPGCDGPQTLARIHSLNPDVLCCFMTGDIGIYTEEHLIDLGAVAVFRKPFRLGEMVAELRRMTF